MLIHLNSAIYNHFKTGTTRRPIFQSKSCIRCVRVIPDCMRPNFQACLKSPCIVIGLRCNNQVCFLDVSVNLEGEELSKSYVVRTVPSSVPRTSARRITPGRSMGRDRPPVGFRSRTATILLAPPGAKCALEGMHWFCLRASVVNSWLPAL